LGWCFVMCRLRFELVVCLSHLRMGILNFRQYTLHKDQLTGVWLVSVQIVCSHQLIAFAFCAYSRFILISCDQSFQINCI
jgi:hypothetical protein